jgi:hypothetical protein
LQLVIIVYTAVVWSEYISPYSPYFFDGSGHLFDPFLNEDDSVIFVFFIFIFSNFSLSSLPLTKKERKKKERVSPYSNCMLIICIVGWNLHHDPQAQLAE